MLGLASTIGIIGLTVMAAIAGILVALVGIAVLRDQHDDE